MLSHYFLDSPLVFDGDVVNVLVIENQDMLQGFVRELKTQIEGYDGRFTLSENSFEIRIDRSVLLTIDPFSIDLNQRDFITKLYAKMREDALGEDEYIRTSSLLAEIMVRVQEIMNRQPMVLESSEVDLAALFKSMNVSFSAPESMLETLHDYMDICSEYRGIKLFVFVNLKSYLNNQDMLELYRHLRYVKRNVLLIEHSETEHLEGESTRIIDLDLCEIDFGKKFIN